jgi:hypothetical protein
MHLIATRQPSLRRAQLDDHIAAIGGAHADDERKVFLLEQLRLHARAEVLAKPTVERVEARPLLRL